jgi:histidyl-tRNA synthetase
MFKSPIGMKDILPEEAYSRQDIENKVRFLFNLYGYRPIVTPVLEDATLFNRSLGQDTEIVIKQMFLVNRNDESYCLRPEATASVARAYLENNLYKAANGFVKLYYIGPMFRAERPQKGRLRQFCHIGVEAIGSDSPFLDSEVIALADKIMKTLEINGYTIKLNSLGCGNDRKKFKEILRARLKNSLKNLCPDCNERYQRNVFRILDCKNEGCKEIAAQLDFSRSDYLCADCSGHFETVRKNLDALSISYSLTLTLVRGLDYYTRSVFEITHPRLGSQDALGAGGRYDHLIHQLGGPEVGAVGFALGVERLLLVTGHRSQVTGQIKVFIVVLGEEARKKGFALLHILRSEGISCDMDYEDRSLKGQMRRANDLGVRFCAILGENELKKQMLTLKDMQSGKQEEMDLSNFVDEIIKKLEVRS